MSFVELFPSEVTARIFSYVDPLDINKNAQYVCKSWYKFFNDENSDGIFWSPLYNVLFDRPPSIAHLLEDEQILLSEGPSDEHYRVHIWRSCRMSLYIRLFVEKFFYGASSPRNHEEKWLLYNRLGNCLTAELDTPKTPESLRRMGVINFLQKCIRTKLSTIELNNILFCVCVESFISSRCCNQTHIRTLDDFSYAHFAYASTRIQEIKTPTGMFSVANLILYGTRIARKAGMRVNNTNIRGLLSGVRNYCTYSNTRKLKVDTVILKTTLEMFDLYDRITQTTSNTDLILAADTAETYSSICGSWDESEYWFFRAVNLYQRIDDEIVKINRVGFLHHMHAFKRTGKTAKQHLLTALENYTMLTNIVEADFVLYGNLADVYTELLHITGDDTEAMEYFGLSVELFMKSIEISQEECVHNNFGWLYLEASRRSFDDGFVEMAINEFEESIKINPHYYNSKSNVGLAYIELARKSSTLIHINKAIKIFKDVISANADYKTIFFMGVAYLEYFRICFKNGFEKKEKILDSALEWCMNSLKLNDGNLLCTFTVAHIAGLKGDMKLCKKYVNRFNRFSGATKRNGDIVLTQEMILENAYDINFHAHSFSWFAAKKYQLC